MNDAITDEEVVQLSQKILAKSADWMAYTAGGVEQFYYIIDAQRIARWVLNNRR